MTWWRKAKPDVPTEFVYRPVPQRSAPNPAPLGIECAEGCRDPNRYVAEACNECGHRGCIPYGPCDICRVTVRIRTLENPS